MEKHKYSSNPKLVDLASQSAYSSQLNKIFKKGSTSEYSKFESLQGGSSQPNLKEASLNDDIRVPLASAGVSGLIREGAVLHASAEQTVHGRFS